MTSLPLSHRERQVMILVGRDGHQWKTVARALGVALSTAQEYGARALRKHGILRTGREGLVELFVRLSPNNDVKRRT